MGDKSILPASIEIAWGLRAQPAKGPKRGLSLDEVVAAGVELAQREGLAAVSMARVAEAVELGTMSLYRYVGSKDELLMLMADAALIGVPAAAKSGSWRSRLTRIAQALFALYRAHPWVLRIPISGPPLTPNQLAWLETGLTALRELGLRNEEKIPVMMLLFGFVRNEAMLTVDLAAAFAALKISEKEAAEAYTHTLSRLITPERFPSLSALLAAGVAQEDDSPERRFAYGLERVLDGIEARINASSRAPSSRKR